MIPKILHFCWISGDEYSPLVKRCLLSWKTFLSDYDVIIWDADRTRSIGSKWVSEAISAKMYAFAADYVRMHALYNYGGIYLDSDVEVLKSFDPLLQNNSFIGLETSLDIEAAIIGSVPRLAWLKSCLDYYTDRSFFIDDDRFDTKPLPLIIYEILSDKHGLKFSMLEKPRHYDELSLKIYPPTYFSPKNRFTGALNVTEETYCIHHLDGKWVKRNVKNLTSFYAHYLLAKALSPDLHRRVINLYRFLRR